MFIFSECQVAGKDNETVNSIAVAFYVYLRKYNVASEPSCVIAKSIISCHILDNNF